MVTQASVKYGTDEWRRTLLKCSLLASNELLMVPAACRRCAQLGPRRVYLAQCQVAHNTKIMLSRRWWEVNNKSDSNNPTWRLKKKPF